MEAASWGCWFSGSRSLDGGYEYDGARSPQPQRHHNHNLGPQPQEHESGNPLPSRSAKPHEHNAAQPPSQTHNETRRFDSSPTSAACNAPRHHTEEAHTWCAARRQRRRGNTRTLIHQFTSPQSPQARCSTGVGIGVGIGLGIGIGNGIREGGRGCATHAQGTIEQSKET